MKVNGEQMSCAGDMTLGSLVDSLQYSRQKIAAEVNGELVPKSEYDAFSLQESDVVEVVSFVGGG